MKPSRKIFKAVHLEKREYLQSRKEQDKATITLVDKVRKLEKKKRCRRKCEQRAKTESKQQSQLKPEPLIKVADRRTVGRTARVYVVSSFEGMATTIRAQL